MADDDQHARFGALIEQYGRLLHEAVARACPTRLGLHADEVEQDARLRLWKALESEREIRDVASYIYRVAATATVDAIRRLKARREEQLPEGEHADGALGAEPQRGGEQTVGRALLLEKVERVLAGLEPRRSQVVRLHVQGFTTAEMGRLMGSTEPAARNLLHRALRELRERLRDEGITYEGD
jgi:RNA polymerase sigma-70 factor (ECF subfamily)